MIPKTFDEYVGLEIECLAPNGTTINLDKYGLKEYGVVGYDASIQDLSVELKNLVTEYDRLYTRMSRLGVHSREWYSIHDKYASIQNAIHRTRAERFEIKLLIPIKQLKIVLLKFHKLVKDKKLYVNKTCGLHVHLDVRDRRIITALDQLYKHQDDLYKVVDKSRLKSTYCSKLTPKQFKNVKEKAEFYKYKCFNRQRKYQTIEVRCHEGTVDTRIIYSWVQVLRAIVDNKKGVENAFERYTRTKNSRRAG